MEAAFITPLFITLIFGILEFGFAYHDKLTAQNMSLAGARSASGQGSDPLADYNTLLAIKQASAAMSTSKITSIVIYKASGPTDRVSGACKSASQTAVCNHYTGADLVSLSSGNFGCVGPPAPNPRLDNAWCPTTTGYRKTALNAPSDAPPGSGPPDYIGVYIAVNHDNATGLFGSSYTFTSDTVYRLEPRTLT